MSTIMIVFLTMASGYALGRVKIAELQLGSAGVLLVALLVGHYGMELPAYIRDLGLALFVTSVGFIAGPAFFRNFRRNALQYIVLGLLIILLGAGVCVAAITLFQVPSALSVGLMAGALTSTPGLAAAIEASGDAMASVGYGIAYPFGVIGVVLFVQLTPRLLGVDIAREAAETERAGQPERSGKAGPDKLLRMDDFGYFPFALAVLLGLLIGGIAIPLPGGVSFSLGTSGGPLLTGLLFGHFSHAGPVSLSVPAGTAKPLREFGLILFLMGAGTDAGRGFLAVLREYGVKLFVIGIFITLIPMLVGYVAARFAMKLNIPNALGSICGGMTSTPALGTLISIAKSEVVATAYAATYPVALIAVVLACQFIATLL